MSRQNDFAFRRRPGMAASLVRTSVAVGLVTLAPLALPAQQNGATTSKTQSEVSGAQTTIKSEVRRVLLDVVVTQGDNHPVTGLQQQDFSVSEDGKPQQIIFFEAHSSASPAASFKPQALPMLPPNTFLNAPTGYENLPLNVLLYDMLNTPVESQPYARKEIIKFLHDKPAGSRFAIFVLGDKVQLLQGFTDDERQLVAAINRKEASSYASTTYQTQEGVHDTSTQLDDTAVLAASDPRSQTVIDTLQHMEAIEGNYFLNQRVEKTVNAFMEIARFVSGMPGRKNLIWLSGSFPSNIFPGNDPVTPFDTSLSYAPQLRQAADLLTAGEIAVYPVDIRGLAVNPVYSAGSSRIYRSPGAFGAAHGRFGQQLAAEHATMDKIADDSGGHAFYDTNGLQKAIATGTDDGANYYTLSYSPTNKKFDGGLRKIKVALGHKGCHLAYRRSYLADDKSVLPETVASATPDPVATTMRRGAPPSHGLVFEVHVMPQGASAAVAPEQITKLEQFPAFTTQKKWDAVRIQRYAIDFAVLGRQLAFTTAASGSHSGKFEFVFAAYNAEGVTMIGQRVQADQAFSQKDFDEVSKGAYRVRQLLDVPSGAVCLRLAVHDLIGNRLGSIEIPLPLAPEPQAQANSPSN